MLLSIDPGINNCGLAVIDYESDFTVLESFNVNNTRRFTPEEKALEKIFGLRVVKVNFILHHVWRLLKAYPDIDHVAIEAPFYSALTPLAYGSLLEVISAIKYTILVPEGIPYSMTEPLLVKRMFINVKLNKDMKKKEAMRLFLTKKVMEGDILLNVEPETLSEHEIDAIAVGYTRAITVLLAAEDAALVPTPPIIKP